MDIIVFIIFNSDLEIDYFYRACIYEIICFCKASFFYQTNTITLLYSL